MNNNVSIKNALISVYNKEGLEEIVKRLNNFGIKIYSTGGTETFINSLDINVEKIEDLTTYPSILGGRVKTLHPKVFGGILSRRDNKEDVLEVEKYQIINFDLVIVDLYPFEQTVKINSSHQEIIEKIDIGGFHLIRAAAKNYKDVLVISNKEQYHQFNSHLEENGPITNLNTRLEYASEAFNISSHYDTMIFNFLTRRTQSVLKKVKKR